MIVELLGGPLDGDGAELDEEVDSIWLLQPSFAAFVNPGATAMNDLPNGYERVGQYVSCPFVGSPTEFSWEPDE